MSYTVIVTPTAQAAVIAAFNYIRDQSPQNAAKWLQGLYQHIDGLEQFPHRFGVAREQAYVSRALRQVVYGSHRIVFSVDDLRRVVEVVHVRHSKQRAVGEPPEEA